MYINRAKALLLVGTIAAGCTSANDDEGLGNAGAGGTAGAGSGGTPSAGGSGQGGSGAGSAGTPSAGGSSQSGPDAGNPGSGGLDAGSPDAGGPDAGGSHGPDAGGDAGGELACDDTADTLVTCAGLEQTECEGLEGFLSSECEMLEFVLKPAGSNAARNCMIALEPPELCEEANTYGCILAALESSCSDPEADDECTTIAAECGDSPGFDTCSAALSGMTQSGRDQMVQCTTESCDLVACIASLTLP